MSEIKTYRGVYMPEEDRYYKISRSKIEFYKYKVNFKLYK